jgi:hypothetical protein
MCESVRTVNKPEVESKKTPCPVAVFRDDIFKLLRSPEIFSKDLIPPAYAARARICRLFKEPRNRFPAWRTGTATQYVVPAT